jgi:hypothetical protein
LEEKLGVRYMLWLATNLVDEDILIGMMDSPELANVAKSGHNLHLRLIERHMTL